MLLSLPLSDYYCLFNFLNGFVTRFYSLFSVSTSLYYCIVYSAIGPLKAASVLNKISCQLSDVNMVRGVQSLARVLNMIHHEATCSHRMSYSKLHDGLHADPNRGPK